jgi:GTPase SAR1 family protein
MMTIITSAVFVPGIGLTAAIITDTTMAAFGQLVTGPPGAGKSTYCHGMHQFLTALDRPVHIINLDPAVENPPYPCAINITDLISLQDIMDEHSLGPNGAMLYAMEYLEANIDWLEDELRKLVEEEERGSCYIIIDTPGQVELWTNHDSLKRIVAKLIKADYRVSSSSCLACNY